MKDPLLKSFLAQAHIAQVEDKKAPTSDTRKPIFKEIL
jgi:hypothetical protein